MDEQAGLDTVEADEASRLYLGQWHGLVSTTNWEKGRIIDEWREALRQSGASSAQYSDDAWSRRVGHVSGQHAGRLRRVYERFSTVRAQYPGLYWSHFQAALDWPDAEMWLEGAVQNEWSISEMRARRWQALGGAGSEPSAAGEPLDAELDEDFVPPESELSRVREPGAGGIRKADAAGKEQAAESESDGYAFQAGVPFDVDHSQSAPDEPSRAALPPLAELPDDLAEAFESYKLAILRHKLDGWRQVGRDDVLATLDALRQLALSPPDA